MDSRFPEYASHMAVLAVLLTCSRGTGQEERGIKDRFLAEAPRQWNAYVSFAKRLQGTLQSSQFDRGKANKPVERMEAEIRQSPPCFLNLRQGLGPEKNDGQVTATNTKYAFELRRRRPANGWATTSLEINPKSRWDEENPDLALQNGHWGSPRSSRADVLRSTCHGLLIFNRWLPSFIRDPEFSLRSVAPEGTTDLVRVEFDYRPRHIDNNPVRGGWILLDPKRYWLMTKYEANGEWVDGKGTIFGEFEFKESPSGVPIITRHTRRQRYTFNKGGGGELEYVFDYDLYEQADRPERDFTLSAFGLPEPEGLRRSYFFIWAGLAGFLCIALAVFLRSRLR